MNLKIHQLKQQLINDINNSDLPISVAVLILDGLLKDAKQVETQQLQKEIQESQNEEESECQIVN